MEKVIKMVEFTKLQELRVLELALNAAKCNSIPNRDIKSLILERQEEILRENATEALRSHYQIPEVKNGLLAIMSRIGFPGLLYASAMVFEGSFSALDADQEKAVRETKELALKLDKLLEE